MQKRPTRNQAFQIAVNEANSILDRILGLRRDGVSFGGKRDTYEAFGYPRTIDYATYRDCYDRGDIAKAVIDAPVKASWRKEPAIFESGDDKETKFEAELGKLLTSIRLFSVLQRLDRLACIGEYAVLLLGFNDEQALDTPVGRSTALIYAHPYSQGYAVIKEYDENDKSPRCGLPVKYELSYTQGSKATTKPVHWSRVIHVANDSLDSTVFGVPVLKGIWNRIEDLHRVSGAGAEGFWRNAFAGLILGTKENVSYDPNSAQGLAIKEVGEDFVHLFQRLLVLDGMEAHQLQTQIADPGPTMGAILDLIAGTCRIPKRILMGSEVGQLASSQDISNWLSVIDERREQHCEPNILRPTIDRLIEKKVLPAPKNGYSVEWPQLTAQSEKEQAEVAKLRTDSFVAYANAPSAEQILPARAFFREVLKMPEDIIDLIEQEALDQIAQEERAVARGEQVAAEEQVDAPEDDADV